MKNILDTNTDGTPSLLTNLDAAENSLYVNGTEVPTSEWIGSDTYTFSVAGHTYSIVKAPDNTGSYQLLPVSDYTYHFVKVVSRDDIFVKKSGDTMTGDLNVSGGHSINLSGGNVSLGTVNSSSNDSGDIVWYYGNGQEKMRLFTDNTYGAKRGINYRLFSDDGTALGAGRLLVTDGDTMSGNLIINKTQPRAALKADNWTITTASNNGLSEDAELGRFQYLGKDNSVVAMNYVYGTTSGAVHHRMYAYNKKTDGTEVTNTIDCIANKDGTRHYSVSDPANFRSAIGAGTSSLTIGTTSSTAAAGNHNHNGVYCYGSARIVAGTVVRSVGQVQWFAPFTIAQIKSLLGISGTPSASNTYVNYTNGDTAAHNYTMTGTSWMNGVPNAVFSATKSGTGNVRFNYIIAYFG